MSTATSSSFTDMLNSSPAQPVFGERTASLLETLNECATTCVICADACLAEDMVTHLRRCISLNLACADTCAGTSRMAARGGSADAALLASSLQHCAEMCRSCAAECETHAGMMEHCRVCAESCRRCEQVCVEAAGTM